MKQPNKLCNFCNIEAAKKEAADHPYHEACPQCLATKQHLQREVERMKNELNNEVAAHNELLMAAKKDVQEQMARAHRFKCCLENFVGGKDVSLLQTLKDAMDFRVQSGDKDCLIPQAAVTALLDDALGNPCKCACADLARLEAQSLEWAGILEDAFYDQFKIMEYKPRPASGWYTTTSMTLASKIGDALVNAGVFDRRPWHDSAWQYRRRT